MFGTTNFWGRGMTFVTLSLHYAGPRIAVGSEFLRALASAAQRFCNKNSSANRKPDSRVVCAFWSGGGS